MCRMAGQNHFKKIGIWYCFLRESLMISVPCYHRVANAHQLERMRPHMITDNSHSSGTALAVHPYYYACKQALCPATHDHQQSSTIVWHLDSEPNDLPTADIANVSACWEACTWQASPAQGSWMPIAERSTKTKIDG